MKHYQTLDREELAYIFHMLKPAQTYLGDRPEAWDIATLHGAIRRAIADHYGPGSRQASHSHDRSRVGRIISQRSRPLFGDLSVKEWEELTIRMEHAIGDIARTGGSISMAGSPLMDEVLDLHGELCTSWQAREHAKR